MTDSQVPGGQQTDPSSVTSGVQQPAPQQVPMQQPAPQPMPQQPVPQQPAPQQPMQHQAPMPQYGQPASPYPPMAQPAEKTGLAIASLILGLVGLIAPWFLALAGYVCGILAIVFGAKTLKTSKRGMAIAGIILGVITLIFSLTSSVLGVLLYSYLLY